MSKTVLLVFAIISLVVGALFMGFWIFLLVMDIAIEAQFPGSAWTPEGLIIFYFTLIMGIGLIVVAVILFILRAKRST